MATRLIIGVSFPPDSARRLPIVAGRPPRSPALDFGVKTTGRGIGARGRARCYDPSMELERIKQVLAALRREGVAYKVFGGVALNLHGLPRFTQDLDLFVAPTAENVDRLRRALDSVFHDPELAGLVAEDLLGAYPAVQYVPPEGDFHVDIVTRLGEAFHYEGLESGEVDLDGLPVEVVTPRQLYEMKKDTVRLRDRGDAELLRERFELDEEEP
jgi:hypothetical protein